MNSNITITNEIVPEIELLFNMIKALQNQVQEQCKLITSLQEEVKSLRNGSVITVDIPKGRPTVDIKSEVDMLLSDDWMSDSKISSETSSELNTVSDSDLLFVSECKEETVLRKKKENNRALNLSSGPVRIIKYTEKSFVVIGDTKIHATILKQMNGKWNTSLTCKETGKKFMGWVFSNRNLEKVRIWIESGSL